MNTEVDRIASRQHSLITTAQLGSAGLTERQILRRQRQGGLDRVRRSVYRLAGSPVSWIQTIHAAVLAAGGDAVISHGTAGACWQLRHVGRDDAGLHLTASRQIRLAGVTSHIASLGPNETAVHEDVPTTSGERTLIDIAESLTPKQLGECLDDALRRKLVRLERLRQQAAVAEQSGPRRAQVLHDLLAERLPGYQPGANDWEMEMDRVWDRLGLPPGKRQHRVNANGHNYIIDRAIPELKIGAEYNGHEHHHRRSDRDRDAQRAAELSAAGWHIIVFTGNTNPDSIRQAVSRIVHDRQQWMKNLPRPRASSMD